jgi:YidC/Oxa1 family membrane protein insertase
MQSQTRNWFLFFGLFFVVMLGHTWLRNKLWPPPPKLTPEAASAIDEAARLLSAYTGKGLTDACTLAVQATVNDKNAADYRIAMREAKAAALAKAEPPKPAQPAKPQAKPETFVLGGGDFLLSVKFTTLGAGVQQLIVNPIPGVNKMGLADKEADGAVKPLELIPEDDKAPSFTIYHYATAVETPSEERPLDTLGTRTWTVGDRKNGADEQSISFNTELPESGVRLIKTYTLRPREFHVGLTVRIERLPDAKEKAPFRYQLAGAHGLPIEGVWYTTVFRNTLVGWVDNKGGVERVLDDVRSLAHNGGSDRYRRGDRTIQYAAVAVQYFISAIVADNDQPNPRCIEFARGTIESRPDEKKPFLDDVTIRTIAEPVDPKPGEPVEHKYLLYHGPIKVRLLSQLHGLVDESLINRYEKTLHLYTFTDYGKFGFWTDLIVWFTNVVHSLIGFFRNILPSGFDAVCIMLVTVIVRGIMFPLSRRQAATMQRTQEQMAKIQPEMKKVKEKFKGDIMAQQQAMSELYRKHGVNPAAGLGGCLMVFVQMPVFLGLYFALQESFLFRLKRFLWAPNLTAPDMMIWWSEKIPFISEPDSLGGAIYLGPYFNLLPVIAMALMLVQQKMMAPPAMDEQAKMQQSIMKYMMIFFCFMFYKVPAGLSLYFICSTLWGVTERKLLPKKKPSTGGPSGSGNGALIGDKPQPGPRGKSKPKEEEPGRLRAWWEKLLKDASKK